MLNHEVFVKKKIKLLKRFFVYGKYALEKFVCVHYVSVRFKKESVLANLNFGINHFLFKLQEMLYINIDPKRLLKWHFSRPLDVHLVCFRDYKESDHLRTNFMMV